ncbi:MAG TPA: PAS domain S-box protein [Prolixibacteraceae bacterium]|nr:PAS domain S-box protein [Prolixibacteraceae bacterium]
MRKFKKSIWFVLVLPIFIIIIGSWIEISKIREVTKNEISGYLSAILGTAHQGFYTWAERHNANSKIWAHETLPYTKELLKEPPTLKKLLHSPAQEKIRTLLRPLYTGGDFEGFFIIGPGNINLASSRDENLGIVNLLASQENILERIWAGETIVSLPLYSDVPLPDKNGKLQSKRATMFVGTPVKDETGKIIAIFTLRINPEKEFASIFRKAQIGSTGETYCVDKQGRMASISRFYNQLDELGLITQGDSEILNLPLTDPGVNLLKHEKKHTARERSHLTRMAESLTARKSGINLDGYLDYRGVPVVGKWIWDDKYGFGIATKIDKTEAYQSFNHIQFIAIIFTFMSLAIIIGLTVFFYWGRKLLEEKEERYRSLYENSTLGIYRTTPKGQILLANPAVIKMLGFNSFEELAKRNIEINSYVDISSKNEFRKHFENNNELIGFESEWYRKDGSIISVSESTRAVKDKEKNVLYYDGTVEDITRRKQSEEKIKGYAEQYDLIKTTKLFGYWLIDEHGKLIDVNDQYCQMTGYTRDELLDISVTEFEVSDDPKILTLHLPQIIKKGTEQFESRHKTKNDGIIDVEISVVYWSSPKKFIAFIRDITDRKQVEEEILKLNETLEFRVKERTLELQKVNESLSLEINEREQIEQEMQKLSQAVEQASAMVVITDKDGNIEYSNPIFTQITGYSQEEAKGKNFRILKSDYYPTSYYKELWATINSGNVWKGDFYNRKKNGDYYWENASISPIVSKNGKITHYVAVKTDITLRKEIEEELKQAKVEAEQANMAKSGFLSRMSHELRTPMNSILGFTQLMNMGELSSAHKKGVDHILKNGKHLLDLINEVLDISKIEAGHISLSLEPIAISPLIQEIIDIVNPLTALNHITLETALVDRYFVKADRQRLKQVLLNLVNNAIKYNRTNGLVKINCELKETPQTRNSTLRINVFDSGKGIQPEDIKKLFMPFERIGAEKTGIEGTGLGLAVAKRLMEAMHGSIGAESQVDVGSKFWIELLQDETQIDRHERLINQINPALKKVVLSGTILYIEDNISNIQLVEQIIQEQRPGIHLIAEIHGANAVKCAIDYAPDLILLDLDLPDIHGSEVLKMLQANPMAATIPVVVISADAMVNQMEKLINAGAKDYLTKPIDVAEFLKMVDDVLNVDNV